MAESPVGRPGGAGAGPHSATAATFQVDDSSLRALRKTWQGLTQDVKAFNAELVNLRKGDQTLTSIQAKLSALGIGSVGGSRGSGGTVTPASFTNTGAVAGSVQPTASLPDSTGTKGRTTTEATFTDTSGGGGMSRKRFAEYAGGATVAGAAAIGGYYKSRMDGIVGGDTFYVDQATAAGGGYNDRNRASTYHFMMGGGGQRGISNYASSADLFQGGNALIAGQGGATTGAGGARTRALFTDVGNMAGLNPTAGFSGSSSAAVSAYSPGVSNRMMAYGMGSSLQAGGARKPLAEIYRDILQRTFRGRTPTAQEITEGMQEGYPLRRTLEGLNLGPEMTDAVVRFGLAQANLGGSFQRADAAIKANAAGKTTADTRLAGLRAGIQSSQNVAGRASARNEQTAGQEGRGGIKSGFESLAVITDKLTGAFQNLYHATGGGSGAMLGYAGVMGGPIAGAVGAMGGPLGTAFGVQTLRGLFKGGASGGVRGALKGGAGAALGASGVEGIPVFVTNMPAGGIGGGLGGLGGGGGGGGGLGGFGSRAKGLVGRLGGAGSLLKTAGAIGGGIAIGYGIHEGRGYLKDHFGHGAGGGLFGGNLHWQDAAQGAAETAQYGAAGAAMGARFGAPGALIGGAVGSVFGVGKSFFDYFGNQKGYSRKKSKSVVTAAGTSDAATNQQAYLDSLQMSSPYNGSAQGDGPGGAGRGPATVSTIEGMARGGPTFRVSSTYRPDAHTSTGNLSYHATNNAVDFTGAKPGIDTAELLGIDKYFASKYGKGLKELIYAGPGGINLLNGAPFIYDAATRAQHHNHVHVAATQDSLRSAGGVSVSSSGNGGASSKGSTNSGVQSAGFTQSQVDILASINSPMAASNGVTSKGTTNGSGTSTAVGSINAAPSDSRANVQLGKRMAAAAGWTGKQWDALYALWQQESGWNSGPSSQNSIGAYGIAQAFPGSRMSSAGPDWRTNPATQIQWGIDYIKGRADERNPVGAMAHKAATDSNKGSQAQYAQPGGWYAKGAYDVFREHMAVIHPSEMVLDANTANRVRSSLRDRSSSEPSLAQSVAAALSDSGGRSAASITIHAPITLVGTATEKNARDFIGKIKRVAERDKSLEFIGKGR